MCICVQELEDLKPRRQPGHRAEAWTALLAEKFPRKLILWLRTRQRVL